MTIEKINHNVEKPENTKERLLNDFKMFRNDFLEGFPDEILLPDMPNYHRYKCRTNFFNNISIRILRIQHEGIKLSNEGKIKCDKFMDYCTTLKGKTERYQQEDIDKANEILDVLINELS
ncbi:hypothetical protein KAU09_01185 [Candidatus Parcubacteria bacterium]|nr:hypothetical protein [Candidatus Parcubacteria bacterium]